MRIILVSEWLFLKIVPRKVRECCSSLLCDKYIVINRDTAVIRILSRQLLDDAGPGHKGGFRDETGVVIHETIFHQPTLAIKGRLQVTESMLKLDFSEIPSVPAIAAGDRVAVLRSGMALHKPFERALDVDINPRMGVGLFGVAYQFLFVIFQREL